MTLSDPDILSVLSSHQYAKDRFKVEITDLSLQTCETSIIRARSFSFCLCTLEARGHICDSSLAVSDRF